MAIEIEKSGLKYKVIEVIDVIHGLLWHFRRERSDSIQTMQSLSVCFLYIWMLISIMQGEIFEMIVELEVFLENLS